MTTQANSQSLFDLIHLYSDYAAAVDSAQWDKWIEFFTDECEYKIQPRENYDRGFPLATLALLSKNMLKDRVYGIHETLYLTMILIISVMWWGCRLFEKKKITSLLRKPITPYFAQNYRANRPSLMLVAISIASNVTPLD